MHSFHAHRIFLLPRYTLPDKAVIESTECGIINSMETYDKVDDNIGREDKKAYWEIAFGLQQVDNLTPSKYVQDLAREHIEGKKSYSEVKSATASYYEQTNPNTPEHEADEVSEAIYEILADASFRFDIPTLKNYHHRLFQNLEHSVYHPGEFRTVNLTKKEPVLDGNTVQYQDYGMIEASLEYDFREETKVNYLELSDHERITNLAGFTSHIWQVHPFYEGNTRTTAVFIEKYLRSLGYEVDNEIFRDHSKEFRDALVLANYSNIPKGIQANPARLIEFFAKMLEK